MWNASVSKILLEYVGVEYSRLHHHRESGVLLEDVQATMVTDENPETLQVGDRVEVIHPRKLLSTLSVNVN